MFEDWNVSHILAVLVALFLFGLAADEYRIYSNKRNACEAVDTLVTMSGRTMAEKHPCKRYL